MKRTFEKPLAFLQQTVNIKKGSALFQTMKEHGLEQRVNEFIESGRTKKKPGAFCTDDVPKRLDILLELGGYVGGGAALAKMLGLFKTKDIDVFFNTQESYSAAFFHVWDSAVFDICSYDKIPYESFDLAVCKFAYSKGDIKIDQMAEDAIVNGISDLCIENVIHPEATVRRMMKYNKRLGMRFNASQALFVASMVKERDLVSDIQKLI